jgi:hypothetical protein
MLEDGAGQADRGGEQMNKQLVLVHGRSQEHRDPATLKREWLDALRAGLARSQLTLPIPEEDVHLPYHGDVLPGLWQGREGQIPDVIVNGPPASDAERDFALDVIRQIQVAAGVTDAQVRQAAGDATVQKGPTDWPWVYGVLLAIDRFLPAGGGAAIAALTNDVYHFLHDPGIRDRIEAGVRSAVRPGVPTVVVGHSLGSIVSYDLLRRDGQALGWQVPLFVTVGAPLAMNAIKQGLAPISFPGCVQQWFNALDRRDIVASHPLDGANFDVSPGIENRTDVSNDTRDHHGISGYLSDQQVALHIYKALQ